MTISKIFKKSTLLLSDFVISSVFLGYLTHSLVSSLFFGAAVAFINLILGLYNSSWTLYSFKDLEKQILSFVAIAFAYSTFEFFYQGNFPNILGMNLVFTGLLTVRFSTRFLKLTNSLNDISQDDCKKVLCYGSGREVLGFMDFSLKGMSGNYEVVGFIDDNVNNVGKVIHNKKVLGCSDELKEICEFYNVTDIIIASGKVSADKIRNILEESYRLGIKVTRLRDNLFGDSLGVKSIVRNINLEDLLDRDKIDVDLSDFRQEVKEKVILVTGAGGSIGSELSRQIVSEGSHKVYLLDSSEYNLFKVMGDIKNLYPNFSSRVTPLLMNISNQKELDITIDQIRPDFIYHAAAYKHVHLLEQNPYDGIVNNVKGTLNLLKAAHRNNVKKFVLVSTDKAVAPTSVMGATKRICELMVSNYATKSKNLYCSVRFGNVLGSSGSLIPILEKRIDDEIGITITDERMERYFMLIPEAVSLILKTSLIASSGDICILKMGKPLKIVDVAKKLILLKGKTQKDVPIIFTGMKKGEKLVEDLYLKGDEIDTDHQDIVVLPESRRDDFYQNINEIEFSVRKMIQLASEHDYKAVELLWNIVGLEVHIGGSPIYDERISNEKVS